MAKAKVSKNKPAAKKAKAKPVKKAAVKKAAVTKAAAKKPVAKAKPAAKGAAKTAAVKKPAAPSKPAAKGAAKTAAVKKPAAPSTSGKPFVAETLADGLRAWIARGGGLDETFSNADKLQVSSKADVAALCEALDALIANPKLAGEGYFSPLFSLVAYFQSVAKKELFGDMVRDGLPRLRAIVSAVLDGELTDIRDDDVLFILKMFAGYKQEIDAEAIAEVARRGFAAEHHMWSVVFGMFDAEHPHAIALVDLLREPLPEGFVGIAYLDMANQLALAGALHDHPFDSNTGRGRLAALLRDPDEEVESYAHSATVALPFLKSDRAALLAIAAGHRSQSVRMEAAWAAAKSGDASGIDRLAGWCLDPNHSSVAQNYLEELGHGDRIPPAAQDARFLAVAEMARWLAHPNELGKPPEKIELYDLRELHWPPTKDRRTVALVRYTDDKGEAGVGMVGSVTFALFSETTADMPAEDVYALHCCWELGQKRDVKAGRRLLAAKNPGF